MSASALAPRSPWLDSRRRSLARLNVVGGAAVLLSYVHGLASNPATRGDLWGGIPASLEPLYTGNMLLAAAGYLVFTYFVIFRLDPSSSRIAERCDYRIFHGLYALVLIPSALWLPLTFEMLASPSTALWWLIRLDLALVGLGALGLLYAIVRVQPVPSARARALALLGCVPFVVQTALLDALVWTAYYPR